MCTETNESEMCDCTHAIFKNKPKNGDVKIIDNTCVHIAFATMQANVRWTIHTNSMILCYSRNNAQRKTKNIESKPKHNGFIHTHKG